MMSVIVKGMDWIRAHLFLAMLGAAGILILVGAIIIKEKAATAEPAISAWSGAGNTPPDSLSFREPLPEAIVTQENAGDFNPSPTIRPLFSYNFPFSNNNQRGIAEKQDVIDLDALKAVLGQSAPQPNLKSTPVPEDSAYDYAYSFIPRGLISTATPAKTLTPEQKVFFDYGNAIGSPIKSFDGSHKNMVPVLTDFFRDHANKPKAAAVLSLANDYEQLGRSLASMAGVPKEASVLHDSLAQGYITVANGLAQLTKTTSDKETVDAVLAYDKSADKFIKNYVAIVDLFSAHEVKFSPSDPGSVFAFPR